MNKLRVFKFWPALAVLSLLLIFSSCGDKTEDPDFRDVYQGTYVGTETWTNNGETTSQEQNVAVSKSSVSINKILLTGDIMVSNQVVDAIVATDGTFSFTFTTQISGASKTVTGSGTITDRNLTFSYSAQGYVTTNFNGTKR